MINSLAPEYISSLVPPTVGNISQYNLRNKRNLQTVPARSQQYYNSFLLSTTRIWNSLSDDTKNSPSVESFKHKLNSNITKPPPYYFSGSQLGQIYHARIRLNCSLRYHLFQKNIIDNHVCECGEIENTSHFFLHCNLYGQLRHALLDRVSTYCQPTVNVFLYGNTDLTDVENAELSFICARLYIKNKTFLLKNKGKHLKVLTKVAHTINQN